MFRVLKKKIILTNYKRHSRSLLKQFKWTNHKRHYWRLLIQFKLTNHKGHNRSLLIMGSCFWLGPLGHCQNITITQILLGSLNLTEYNLLYSWHSLMTTLLNIHHESAVTPGKSSGPFITLYTNNGSYIPVKVQLNLSSCTPEIYVVRMTNTLYKISQSS